MMRVIVQKKFLKTASALFIILSFGDGLFLSFLQAQQDCGHCRAFDSEAFAHQIADELHLSTQQFDEIKTILYRNAEFISQKREALNTQIKSIRQELSKDTPDLKNLNLLMSQKSRTLADMEYASLERDLKIKSLLNEKQIEEWKESFQERNQEKGRPHPPEQVSDKNHENKEKEFSKDSPPQDFSKNKIAQRREDHLAAIIQSLETELQLSNAQQQAIEKILQDSFHEMTNQRARLYKNFIAVRDELRQEQPDLKKIYVIIQEKSQILSTMEYISIARDLQLKTQLSQEQIEHWQALVRKRFIYSHHQKPHMPFILIRDGDD